MEKKDNWFKNYQTIGNITGQRDLEYRKKYFKKEDFINKDIIDIGCNIGQMCFFSKELGAKNVLGIDYDKEAIKIANTINKYNDVLFQTDDIDNYLLYTSLPCVDTILLLSVIGTQELTNKSGIISKLSQLTKNTMYIEGHHNVMKYEELFDIIIRNTTFTTIEYLGKTYDNIHYEKKNLYRDLFRCSRDELNENTFKHKIKSIIENNNESLNAITGHGGSGKSYLRLKLLEFLENEKNIKFESIIEKTQVIFFNKEFGIIITDDIPLNILNNYLINFKHKFIFDYRAVEYLKNNDITNLFHIKSDIKTRINNRSEDYHYDRSLPLNARFIKNIYHISNYNSIRNTNIY